MSKKKNSKEEEVELGSLFTSIGKGFKALFNFIATILIEAFHFVITVLLFVKANIIKLTISIVIGAVVGTFFELNKETEYDSNLQVQPNFKSARQLYNTINYYNDLVVQKDTLVLANTFHISSEEAASLKKFEVTPIENKSDLISSFDELILSFDSISSDNYSFTSFKKAFTKYDYKIHTIRVTATNKSIFSKLDEVIISSVVNNNYFSQVKALTNENLTTTDSLLRQNLSQIDTLRKVYMEVLLEEAKKQSTGTSIDLGSAQKSSKEIDLFETSREISKDLKKLSKDKAEKSEVINVISNFQPIGHQVKDVQRNYGFLGAIFGVSLMVLFLLFLKLNSYLDNYKK